MEKRLDTNEVIEEFEAMTKDAGRVQEETLKKIPQEDGQTEYLQKWGLGGRTDPKSFTTSVPIVTHQDAESYIQRTAEGEDSPLRSGKPITTISLRLTTYMTIIFLTMLLSSYFCAARQFPLDANVAKKMPAARDNRRLLFASEVPAPSPVEENVGVNVPAISVKNSTSPPASGD